MTDDIAIKARRRTGRMVGIATITAVVLIAVLVGLGSLLDSTEATSPPGSAIRSGPGGAGQLNPAAVGFEDVAWVELIGMKLPVSKTAGPLDTAGGRCRGFAHNEQGALFAAVHLSIRATSTVGPDVFGPVLKEQLVGPDAAALREHVELAYESERARAGVAPGRPVHTVDTILRGYRIDSYTPSVAAVRLLVEGHDLDGAPFIAVAVVQVQWTGQDWSLVAPPGGRWDSTVSIATDTVGFTELTPEGRVR